MPPFLIKNIRRLMGKNCLVPDPGKIIADSLENYLNKHPEFKNFAARYREYYDKHIKENLRRFYDGDVFGAVVEEFRSKAEFYDMCRELSKGYKTPLKHTWLGPYIHHYKAKHSKASYAAQ